MRTIAETVCILHRYDVVFYLSIVIWDCYPHVMLTIQNSAIDYISGFFTVLDAYMSIEYDLFNSYS